MFFEHRAPSGKTVRIVISQFTMDRLSKTCFRGREVQCAGNFHRWTGANYLLRDEHILTVLLREIEEVAKNPSEGSESVTIEYSVFVGWESTADKGTYLETDLEEFSPNRHSIALRLKTNRTDLQSPQTRDVTIIFEFHLERDTPTILIKSIYPGVDIGELDGDVTRREGRVSFDWNHPGKS